MNETASYNTNENVKVIVNAKIDDREMMNHIVKLAAQVVDGVASSMHEDFADIFSLEIVSRPSGSKYAVVDFA